MILSQPEALEHQIGLQTTPSTWFNDSRRKLLESRAFEAERRRRQIVATTIVVAVVVIVVVAAAAVAVIIVVAVVVVPWIMESTS